MDYYTRAEFIIIDSRFTSVSVPSRVHADEIIILGYKKPSVSPTAGKTLGCCVYPRVPLSRTFCVRPTRAYRMCEVCVDTALRSLLTYDSYASHRAKIRLSHPGLGYLA